jgi:hypothetical protein
MNTAVHRSPNNLRRSNSIFNLCSMYTTSLRYTLPISPLPLYTHSVDGAVKGGGWVEEIKKFLNMKIKKFPRNSGVNLPNFHEAEFHVNLRDSDQFRIAYALYV